MARDRLWLLLLAFVVVTVTGCGTMSRALKSASADSPHVAIPPAAVATTVPVDDASQFEAALAAAIVVAPHVVVADDRADVAALLDVPDADPAASRDVVAETEILAFEADADGSDAPVLVAQAGARDRAWEKDEYDVEEYDPWEPFNERMFEFNRKLDRYVLKPVAQGYDKVVPVDVQRMIANAFDNLGSFRRLVNSLFQAKWDGAIRELSRFMLNTTMGIGGLFDVARQEGIDKSREDFGQTLGVYGVGPGPYLILPFLEPLTIRDGVGRFVDTFIDPLGYFSPLSFIWEGLALRVEEIVNDRSLNLELFQGFEETVIDMYSAVRHAYLERRRNQIKE